LSAFALDAVNSVGVLHKSEVGLSDFLFLLGPLVEVERDGDEVGVSQMLSSVFVRYLFLEFSGRLSSETRKRK
jgi:hypothetical protein